MRTFKLMAVVLAAVAAFYGAYKWSNERGRGTEVFASGAAMKTAVSAGKPVGTGMREEVLRAPRPYRDADAVRARAAELEHYFGKNRTGRAVAGLAAYYAIHGGEGAPGGDAAAAAAEEIRRSPREAFKAIHTGLRQLPEVYGMERQFIVQFVTKIEGVPGDDKMALLREEALRPPARDFYMTPAFAIEGMFDAGIAAREIEAVAIKTLGRVGSRAVRDAVLSRIGTRDAEMAARLERAGQQGRAL